MSDYLQAFHRWLDSPLMNKEELEELESLKNDEKLLYDCFYTSLEFGTGGIRGKMGMGPNRLNRFVIAQVTQGLANYLNKIKSGNSVAIGYDSRINSKEFAFIAANVLAANSIKAFIYDHLMPTPSVSFAVRHLHCDAGIIVTASHNPQEYNGYKVYDNTGCQCTLDMADAIYREIQDVDILSEVKNNNEELVNIISDDVEKAFITSSLKQSIYQEERVLNLVYTPLNGAGFTCITTALRKDGFNNIALVKEQCEPDGRFPTCPYPNPENIKALELGIALMLKENADVLIASDPDSDRLGCVVNNNGKTIPLSGNEVGMIILNHLLKVRDVKNPVVVKTIVSTPLVDLIAEKYHCEVRNVLTGFKFIGDQMNNLEKDGELGRYLFGFEESMGYLTNPDCRDKDAINAALLLMEIANHLKLENKTLLDELDDIYREFGRYVTAQSAFSFEGEEGKKKIADIMNSLRGELNIPNLTDVIDYAKDDIYVDGKNLLPKSNVIKLVLKDHETIIARPSGTEPKIKFYIFAKEERIDELKKLIEKELVK